MRAFALAALVGLGLATAAEARPFTDSAGRLVIDVPANWVVSDRRNPNLTHVIAGNANNECVFTVTPNPGTASATVSTVRRTIANDAQFTDAFWVQAANGMASVFPDNSAAFISRTRDDTGAWPMQRAELRSPERQVHAALQLRPGFDIMGYCMTYGGADPVAVYDQVLRTMGHPNDAAFLAQGETEAAARAAREAAAAAPPPPPPEERRRRRND
jgi:hypothetical protein